MQKGIFYVGIWLVALCACALIAAGCGGGGNDTTAASGSTGSSATQRVDAAVKSCNQKAQQLGGSASTTLSGACKLVGASADEALKSGSANAKQALSQATSSCRAAVAQIPSGQAQDALSKLCDAIAAAQ